AAATAQVIELRAPHVAAPHQLDRLDQRAVQREHALDAFAVGNFPNRERRVHAGIAAGDAHALECLQTLAVAFDDAHLDAQRVAGRKIRDRLLLGEARRGGRLELLDPVHRTILSVSSSEPVRPPAPRDISPTDPAAAPTSLSPPARVASGGSSRDGRKAEPPAPCVPASRRAACNAGTRADPPRNSPRRA